MSKMTRLKFLELAYVGALNRLGKGETPEDNAEREADIAYVKVRWDAERQRLALKERNKGALRAAFEKLPSGGVDCYDDPPGSEPNSEVLEMSDLTPRVWRRWKGKFNCWEYYDEQMCAMEGIEAPPGNDWQLFVPVESDPSLDKVVANFEATAQNLNRLLIEGKL